MPDPDSALNVAAIATGMLGGLSLFLFGMSQMTDALKIVAGDSMRALLGKLTRNRFAGAATGAFVTAVVQSSSVTTVLLVGFVTAGLMTLPQCIGVIMGANIGSTVTAQLIAFKITQYALPMITIGFAMLFVSRRQMVVQIGVMIMGLGMIFFGMGLMSEATVPLRDYPPFIDAMRGIDKPLLAILAAAAFTALIQSSAATTGIVIVLASQGYITLEAGIALALGSNIGTCATALLAALGKPRAAMQTAVAHILFNIIGVLLWLPLLDQLADIVRVISPVHENLEGTARMAAETPRQIANAHTLFNVANTLIFIWFTGLLAKLVRKIVPEKPEKVPEVAQPKYLDPIYLQTPGLALDRLRMEVGHLGERLEPVLDAAFPDEAERPFDEVRARAALADVHAIDSAILDYARQISQEDIPERDALRLERLLAVRNHLQSIADTIDVNLRAIATEWRRRRLKASPETQRRFVALYGSVAESIRLAVQAVRDEDRDAARRVVGMKAELVEEAADFSRHLGTRLSADDPERLATYRLESEAIELLKRLYYFAKRIAKVVATEIEEADVGPEEIA